MTKSDYNSEFEENRKEIDLGEDTKDDLPSRVKLRQNKNATPKRNKKESRKGLTLINVILVLFTLIPIGIFVYVLSDLYNPKEEPTVIDKSGVKYELGASQSPNSSNDVASDSNEKEDDDSKKDDNAKKDEKTDSQKSENKPVATPKPDPKPDPKPETKPEPKPDPKPEKKPDPKPEEKPAAKSHTVQPNETLYRISVTYYGSGSGVEKIKAANGLSSNSISVGQTLVIP